MNPLLSICIPTYNRRLQLKECLDRLIPQAQKYFIPIYISDNASRDGTEELIAGYQQKYSLLFYTKHDVNSGLDINMLRVISMANSLYAWWLGDDDIIENDGIKHLLEILDEKKFSFVLVNGGFISGDLESKPSRTTLNLGQNTVINQCSEFFRDNCFNMPFGTLVVNTQLYAKHNYSRYVGTSHAYSGAVLDYLAEEYIRTGENRIMLVSKSIVRLGYGEKSWSSQSAEIHLIQIPEWFERLHSRYQQDAAKILKKYLAKFTRFRMLWKFWCMGQLDLSNVNRLIQKFPPVAKLKAFIIVRLPVWMRSSN
jgi:glycosyltransferase involved in cell wall biosynthesis